MDLFETFSNFESLIKYNGDKPEYWVQLKESSNINPKDTLDKFTNQFWNLNTNQQILALDVLDYLIDKCNSNFYLAVGQKQFIGFIISILKSKDAPEQQMKVLGLIEKWGERFKNEKETVPNFSEVYNSLKKNGVIFPQNFQSNYHKYLIVKEDLFKSNQQPNISNNNISQNQNSVLSQFNIKAPKKTTNNKKAVYITYFDGVDIDLSQTKFPKKFSKFVPELKILLENIKLSNEIIDCTDYKQKTLDENVRLVVNNLRDMAANLTL